MANYQQETIKLREAMTMDLKQSCRLWTTPGIHVEIENVPENATNIKTTVCSLYGVTYSIGVEWTVKKDTKPVTKVNHYFLDFDREPKTYLKIVVRNISSLEELQTKFQQLFELEGYLYALH